jgi:hypothetical protein
MTNVVTNTRTITSPGKVIQYITIASDGTEETDLVVYDSSAVHTALGNPADSLTCTILSIYATVSAAQPDITGTGARVFLEFDATTDVLALDIPPNQLIKNDFTPIGGLRNTAGTGITGDIMLNTTGLENGDKITIILAVKPY